MCISGTEPTMSINFCDKKGQVLEDELLLSQLFHKIRLVFSPMLL